MQENCVRVALDIMGGDNAPDCNLMGAAKSLEKSRDLRLMIVGPQEMLKERTAQLSLPPDRIELIPASEVISTEESPVQALRLKKDSTIAVGARLVKEGKADAFVSAGSSGALLAAGQLIIGRQKGVLRPPLATLIPTGNGKCLMLDLGANVDAKPEWLHQFALMGTACMEAVEQIKNPSLKLVNLGLEEEKGSQLTKEANILLRDDNRLHYEGYAEAREIPYGTADIVVTDAFTGNAILKMYEGTGGLLLKTVKDALKNGSFLTKLGALLIRKDLKTALKPYDISAYGGAMLLGIRGILIKCHGNSGEKEICNGILQAQTMEKNGIKERIANMLDLG